MVAKPALNYLIQSVSNCVCKWKVSGSVLSCVDSLSFSAGPLLTVVSGSNSSPRRIGDENEPRSREPKLLWPSQPEGLLAATLSILLTYCGVKRRMMDGKKGQAKVTLSLFFLYWCNVVGELF